MNFKMKKTFILIALLLVGCSNFPINTNPQFNSTPTQTLPTQTPEPEILDFSAPTTLSIWLPPAFDPNLDSAAGSYLNDYLNTFRDHHPGTRIETRIKAIEGPASLFESLSAAQSAAPATMPDLAILSVEDMQKAAERDLILPLSDDLGESLSDEWYPFASSMAMHDETLYGLPIAVDALVMVYRPTVVITPPSTWLQALESDFVLSFPPADPKSDYSTALYLSQQDTFFDDGKNIVVNQQTINSILGFYANGKSSGLFPIWLAQFENDDNSWQAFSNGQASMAITWSSRYLGDEAATVLAAPIPTIDGSPTTITKGWVIVLSNADPAKQSIALELAQTLTTEEFLGTWNYESGYFPPKPNALTFWPDSPELALASQILPSAYPALSQGEINLIGPALSQASLSVLKEEASPEQAAQVITELFSNQE